MHLTYMCPQQQQVQDAYYAQVQIAREAFLAPEGASPYIDEEYVVAPLDLFPSHDEIDELFKQQVLAPSVSNQVPHGEPATLSRHGLHDLQGYT